MPTIQVFYSYAHEDLALRDELDKHLSVMKRQGLITSWYDQDINAGTQWANEIDTHLNTANIILLLISPDFMHSDYCYSIEMTRALRRHEEGDARVIPILLRPVDWEPAEFSKLQVLPTNGIPVSSWPKLDDAFVHVAKEIRKVVLELHVNLLARENFDEYKVITSQHTLAGRMASILGFNEADFDKRIHENLTKACRLYLKEYPDTGGFLHDPVVAQQIGNFVLDRQPIDEAQFQQILEQYQLDGYTISNLLKIRGTTPKQIIDDFLQCYRQILSEQLSVPEMGLLLDVFEQMEQVIHEIKESEERLTQHITALVRTTLSPAMRQNAYQAGQQQLVASTAILVQAAQATRTRPHLPKLFADGLCTGRPLYPAPDRYFVSHGLAPDKLVDWRESITETLEYANHSTQPLQPYFSGDKLLAGFRLCGICERIHSTTFSLFLLPATQDRNIYLELGIAIGLGKPFFLIRDRNAQIPPVLTSLALYTHGGSFRTMRRELAEQIEEYDFAAVRFTQEPKNLHILPQYLMAAGESFDDEDFEGSVDNAIQQAYPQEQLIPFSLSQHLKQRESLDLRQLVEQIQTARFAIYRVDELSSTTTFLALGMSIGLNCPFIMISQKGNGVPLNLRGLGIYQFANYTELERNVAKWHRYILDKYAQ